MTLFGLPAFSENRTTIILAFDALSFDSLNRINCASEIDSVRKLMYVFSKAKASC